MNRIQSDVVFGNPPCQDYRSVLRRRRFNRPALGSWSIEQAEAAPVTGQARADYERELRISAIGKLLESPAATPLWRRVCKHAMYSEIRGRSADQRLVMELAIQESMR
ncbi:TPA: hypothetical protein QDB15_006721 [Burkholderia vietnamiensis]|uniref:hypothetical protein n=1 Tax=Burkholderia cepacia complex TaxID=87882 RepID=UPI000A3F7741|nr:MULTISPECIES: hypothetical protein [Burkholderia cepacia complex]MCA8212221.1 hypothetical protein [Burkholderia vietnamiensis]MDN8066188.1 hypothetical protein [Burkholderia vietnamiensis]HDR9103163.1 hypothetical protein [Burkholderia vietnamiensis]HDR9122811.1 hypothetical protein [Burkholderia vietnamiensis]HDR9172686.1 hypothetical protein [Burkholderia vietnamiensis]